MNKFKKTFATGLSLCLIFGFGSKAFADENPSGPSFFEILTGGKNEAKTKEDTNKDQTKEEEYEKDPAYQEEFKARLDLYEKILIAKDLEEIDKKAYIDILNKKAATKEELEKATKDLDGKIQASKEKVNQDINLDEISKDVKNYILYGKLFFLDKIDKKDIKNLYLFYEARVNSTSFTKASEEEKKESNPLLQEIYDYILEIDEKVKGKVEITEEDKNKTSYLIEKLSKDLDKKIQPILDLKSTNVEQTAFLTSSQEVDGTLNENSAFYKSERPGIKEAYQALSEKQRTFLDNINTDNNDTISDEEIKANGEYSLPLDDTNFIRTFQEKTDEEKKPDEEKKSAELTSTEVKDGENSNKASAPAASTPQNPSSTPPETVTISQGENKSSTEEEKKPEDAPTTSTAPASQVKTGVRGVGFLGIVLVLAIIAFVILNKKKKEK